MAVIERDECSECGSAEAINTKGGRPWCGHHPGARVERVEYVPASHLAGAVSALDALRRAADAFDATLSSTVDGPERDALRAASVAASRVGGQ